MKDNKLTLEDAYTLYEIFGIIIQIKNNKIIQLSEEELYGIQIDY